MHKKCLACIIGCFVCASVCTAEVLSWRANAGKRFEATVTVTDSLISVDSVVDNPVVVTERDIMQEEAAARKSTIPYLSSIPSFPKGSISPGARWQSTGKVHYNLASFGMKEPLVVEVTVSYTYVGMKTVGKRSYCHITAEWRPVRSFGKVEAAETGINRISGISRLDLYWDNKAGCPKKASLLEEVQYRFTDGTSLMTRRTTDEVFKTTVDLERETIVRNLKSQITSQKVADVDIVETDTGVALSVENIQFEPDSARILDSEKAKLRKIAAILSSFKGNALSVVGHAANPGGSSERELVDLSTARAKAVAAFLSAEGMPGTIAVAGKGASEPLASNDTAAGRSKNRRVEIVIMDKEIVE